MKIETSRFGKLDITKSDVIEFKGAILGFERFRRFVLLVPDGNTPLSWLQSLEKPSLAFVVINPFVLLPDYQPLLKESDWDFLGLQDREAQVLLAIVTVHSAPFQVTANLRAPLLINATNKQATQIILEDNRYPIQQKVIQQKAGSVELADRHKGIGGWSRLAFNLSSP